MLYQLSPNNQMIIRQITNYNYNLDNTKDIISLICDNLHIKDDDNIIIYSYFYQDWAFITKNINCIYKSIISKKNKKKNLKNL